MLITRYERKEDAGRCINVYTDTFLGSQAYIHAVENECLIYGFYRGPCDTLNPATDTPASHPLTQTVPD